MQIHSSSLAAIPLSQKKAQAEGIARVSEKLVTEHFPAGKQADEKFQKTALKLQTPAEIEQVLEKEKRTVSNDLTLSNSVNKPFNPRAQQALNAYAAQENILIQNRRANLIVGVDFYA